MTAELATSHFITVEDYLAGEERAAQKHEYLAGIVYAMAGATNAHNVIAANLLIALGNQLRGKGCRPFNSDTKVRIRLADQTRFYYPDVQVICRPNSLDDHFQDYPAVIFEVISESTRRIDEQEKRAAYLAIPTLNTYVLIEQDRPVATVWRRTGQGFVREDYAGMEAVLAFGEIDAHLTLGELREGIE
jgi:Uma2 family endonuclease